MPFAVMLYLMMTLAQLHGTQMLWRNTVLASQASFALAAGFSDLKHEVRRAARADGDLILPGEETSRYRMGLFVPP